MRICLICGGDIKGRQDKKYCSAKCKNSATYDRRLMNEQFFLQVDKQLKTNRKVYIILIYQLWKVRKQNSQQRNES